MTTYVYNCAFKLTIYINWAHAIKRQIAQKIHIQYIRATVNNLEQKKVSSLKLVFREIHY